jgi:hypothetical protein
MHVGDMSKLTRCERDHDSAGRFAGAIDGINAASAARPQSSHKV